MDPSLRWDDGRGGRGVGYVQALGLFGAVLLIALAVRLGWTVAIDRHILFAFAPPRGLVPVIEAVTFPGDSATRIGIAALAALLLLVRRRARQALMLVLVVAAGAVVNSTIKAVVHRPRPDLLPHLDRVTSWSFPSGHAANGAILYLALALVVPPAYRRAALVAAILLVAAIGLSRIALAVHWPSDVAAGWCVGAGWILLWRNHLRPAESG